MGYVKIKYKEYAFEENAGLITWLQKFLIRKILDISNTPPWTNIIVDEWKMNSEIEIYKYFFDEDILNEEYKISWSIKFMDEAIQLMNNMTLADFSRYIEEEINPVVDYNRLKKILLNIKLMLEGKDPINTFN
jgi:hypothetical protein